LAIINLPVNNPPSVPTSSGDSFPCQNCGAKLQYDATVRAMKCPYCGTQQAIPKQQGRDAPEAGREIPIEEGMRLAARGLGTPVTQVSCNDCGATVNVTPGEQTAKCAFCGSEQVLAQEAPGTAIRPESLVPFLVDKAGANRRFEQWLAKLWFRPSDLRRMARLQEMGGVYIPFWTFDAWVRSNWHAEAGYHFYETDYYTDDDGNRQAREVQRTRWEPASGWRNDFFDDTLVCASKGLPPALVARFRSFDTKQLSPYKPEFLAGWRAEAYAVDLMPAWGTAQDDMRRVQQLRCDSDVPGDTHRNLHVQNHFFNVTFKHILLPIWIAAYRYNGKPYQFLVNGQTGEVVGKAPSSFLKILLFVSAILAFVGVGVAAYVALVHDTPRPRTAPTRALPPPSRNPSLRR
jgi:DNA-directed RNA polymerase subunit RPC12/RpoP